jgi:hypothetical protein
MHLELKAVLDIRCLKSSVCQFVDAVDALPIAAIATLSNEDKVRKMPRRAGHGEKRTMVDVVQQVQVSALEPY